MVIVGSADDGNQAAAASRGTDCPLSTRFCRQGASVRFRPKADAGELQPIRPLAASYSTANTSIGLGTV